MVWGIYSRENITGIHKNMNTRLNKEQDAVNPLNASFCWPLAHVPEIMPPPLSPNLRLATLATQS